MYRVMSDVNHRLLRTVCTLVFASLIASLLSGCRTAPGSPASGNTGPTAVVFALFDLSGSVSSRIKHRYLADYTKVATVKKGETGYLTGGEILKGDVITENTLASASYPINFTFPVYSPWKSSPMKHAKKMKDGVEHVQTDATNLMLKAKPAPSTDLMNAFQLAEQVFTSNECRGAKEKTLLVFSDMLEQSKRYNFDSERLTDKRISEIIARERKDGHLPDLKGVRVWVAGATASAGGSRRVNPEKIYQIRNFWLAYFKASGADLSKNHYAATLVDFRLHPGAKP